MKIAPLLVAGLIASAPALPAQNLPTDPDPVAPPGAADHVVTFLAGAAGSLLLTIAWVGWGPNWEDAEERGVNREDLGWYLGPPVGGLAGVWLEGSRRGRGSYAGSVVGTAIGLGLAALHADASDGDSSLSYALLGLLPPLGGTLGWAWGPGGDPDAVP